VIRTLGASVVGAAVIAGVSVSAIGTSSAAAKAPLVIGYDGALSGPTGDISQPDYFMAYIKYINAHGGVDGHQIKVVLLDDKGDPGQQLLNYETMWSQDHVVAIGSINSGPWPYQYVRANNIPVVTQGFAPQIYNQSYASFLSIGGTLPTWGAQTAYFTVKTEHKTPTAVEEMYLPSNAPYIPWIKQYWHKLGVNTVYFDPDGGPSADCTALVLKMKDEHVDYFDAAGIEINSCIEAESRLNWHAADGNGGVFSASARAGAQIGAPIAGWIGGSPDTFANGTPIHPTPQLVNRIYRANIIKYVPAQYAGYSYINSPSMFGYNAAQVMVYFLKGTLEKYGKVTPPLFLKYAHSVKNLDDGLQNPIVSFSPACKTGSDATWWGYWVKDPNPAPGQPAYYMKPFSGTSWVTNKWLGLGKCYLTDISDKLFPAS
jgi:hypothetical protein